MFLAIAIADLICVSHYQAGRVVTKPLIMIALISYYVLSTRSMDWLFVVGLFFAFMGDVFLLSDSYFLFGLGSFLIMQIVYAICFFKQRGSFTISKIAGVFLVVCATGLTLFKLLPSLESSMTLPVIIYSSAIGLMAIAAILRSHKNNSYLLVLLGVVSFLISDAILGWNKFAGSLPYAGLLIMGTYILAQYLIVKGYLQYESSNNADLKA